MKYSFFWSQRTVRFIWGQEKMMGQRGTLRASAGICRFCKVIFSLRRKRKCVSRDVRKECNLDVEIPFSIILKLAFIDKLYVHAIRHYFAFTKNILSRSALMRTSRKTYFRSRAPPKITLVELTYPKGWTEKFPLCPLIFSWWGMGGWRALMGFGGVYFENCMM